MFEIDEPLKWTKESHNCFCLKQVSLEYKVLNALWCKLYANFKEVTTVLTTFAL